MTSSTIDLDTELSAVNSILGSIGQSPITSINYNNPEVSFVYNLLKESNIDIQSEGWSFNKEDHVTLSPDVNGYITIPQNALQYSFHDGLRNKSQRLVRRNGRLYDTVDHTDVFTTNVSVDVVWLYELGDLPQAFRRYIIYTASTRAATQLVGNPQLARLLSQQEALARATCLEYECNQGNHSMFNFPEDSSFTTYPPWRTLRR